MANDFSWNNALFRLGVALLLVLATYNPSGYSYFHWALIKLPEFSPLKGLAGVVLVIGWTMFIRATLFSLGWFGIILATAFFGLLLWLVVDFGLVPANSVTAMTWLILVALAGVLGAGASWSHVRRRFSGQRDTDDVEE